MNLDDLKILLTQSLGLEVIIHENYIASYWKLANKIEKQVLFFLDTDTRLLYISTRFDEKIQDHEFLVDLLKENLKLSIVKFCMDKDGDILALAEIPEDFITDELLRKSIFAIYKASERFHEFLAKYVNV